MSKSEVNFEKIIKKAIKESVAAAINAGYSMRDQSIQNYYKQTEKRLYAYNSLVGGIEAYKEEISDLEDVGMPGKSKSIVFVPSGSRICGEDLLSAKIQDLKYKIQRNQREIKNIDKALDMIKKDEYCNIIKMKYIDKSHLNDDEIANKLNCDPSTIRRNRRRLVNKIEIFFYGADALN